MIQGVVGRVVGFLPWGSEGVPEHIVPEPQPGYFSDWVPRADWVYTMTWADVGLRVLPDGGVELLARTDVGIGLVRLGGAVGRRDIASAGYVIDAVGMDDGSVLLLEKVHQRMWVVRRTAADGTTVWILEYPAGDDGSREVDFDSYFLVDAVGRVLLANRGSLLRVDDGSGRCVHRWLSAGAVIYSDGRIGYCAALPRRFEYVTVDVDTGTETVVEVEHGYETRRLLARLIGVDGVGRVYGESLRMMSGEGELRWVPRVGGIVVTAERRVVLQTHFGEYGRGIRIGELALDVTDHRGGRLIDCVEGGYRLRQQVTPWLPDEVVVFDSAGRFVRSEPSPADVALSSFVTQRPTRSSVTKDGEVLIVVKAPAGVYVVGVRPDGMEG